MTSRMAVPSAGCLATVLLTLAASAQGPAPRPPEPVLPGGVSMDAFVEGNTRLPQILRNIPQYVKDREWHTLAHALHMLLDASGGALLQERGRDTDGKPFVRWHSPHVQVNDLMNALPVEALKVYNEHYGDLGRQLLARAKKENDPRLLVQVVRRSLYTTAGPEALMLLGGRYFEGGRYLPAALCYERLLRHRATTPSAVTLYRAAVAFRLTGDRARADLAWKALEKKVGKDGLQLGDRKLSIQEVRQELERVAPLAERPASDWLLFQGNGARSGKVAGGVPLLNKVKWQRRTLLDVFAAGGEADKGKEAQPWLDRAVGQRLAVPEAPLTPGFFPLAIGDKLIYRTYAGVTCVQLTELKDKQGKVEANPGEIEWKSTELDGSLAMLLSEPTMRASVESWLQSYQNQGFGNVLFENAAAGTLSSDGQLVYVVDDLTVPPVAGPGGQEPRLEALRKQNSLQAFQVRTGKIEWRQGNSGRADDAFTGSHWLGAPLPVGGGLYALNETNDGRLRLVSLDPAKGGKVLSLQTLAAVQDRFATDALRRTQPVHLAYGEGVLVCPTNAGAVLGVDLLTQEVVWAYTYRAGKPAAEKPPRGKLPPPRLHLKPEWVNAAPVVQGGKVVFTAADEGSIHCLDLRDGSLLWKAKRDEDVYLAGVYGGKVLLVGKDACRALDLKDGKQLWRVETGVPSGMGVAGGDTYYLPLRSRAGEKRPAVCAVDMGKGEVAHLYTGLKEIPGNLLFHAGQLISQGPTAVTAYPLRKDEPN